MNDVMGMTHVMLVNQTLDKFLDSLEAQSKAVSELLQALHDYQHYLAEQALATPLKNSNNRQVGAQ